jgi:hypothetical protein
MPTRVELRFGEVEETAVGDEPASALEYIRDVYRGRRIADPWRMRAAIAALPFESPKLSVIASVDDRDGTFAERLDRAIERSSGMKAIEHQSEAEPRPMRRIDLRRDR